MSTCFDGLCQSGPFGYIYGTVMYTANYEPIVAAKVSAFGREATATVQTEADIDGGFRLRVPVGVYDVQVECMNCQTTMMQGVTIADNGFASLVLGVKMVFDKKDTAIRRYPYKLPLIIIDKSP